MMNALVKAMSHLGQDDKRQVTLSNRVGTQRIYPALSLQGGFTLVEAIVVIVITAIIGGMVAVFIRIPVQGYVDTAARAELTDVADTALRRMARDLRLALPNSIRISADGRYLELLLTKTGGRYLAEEDDQNPADILSFTNPNKLNFNVVGTMPVGAQTINPGDSIVVYNLGPGLAPADAYTGANRAVVNNVNGNTITLTANPFAQQNPAMASPTNRFQVVTTPVTYLCDGAAGGNGQLVRYWNYQIQPAQPFTVANQPNPPGTNAALLATGVQSCVFDYTSLANTHSGLISLTITLQVPHSNSGAVVLSHQVHVDNTP
jgi:MSHA biogenesis protein MshO